MKKTGHPVTDALCDSLYINYGSDGNSIPAIFCTIRTT